MNDALAALPSLTVISGAEAGRRIPLTTGRTTVIGRSLAADLTFPDEASLSRIHARIDRTEDEYILKDLGSVNGTLVNGRELTDAVALAHEDLITCGTLVLRFELPFAARHTAPPVALRQSPPAAEHAADVTQPRIRAILAGAASSPHGITDSPPTTETRTRQPRPVEVSTPTDQAEEHAGPPAPSTQPELAIDAPATAALVEPPEQVVAPPVDRAPDAVAEAAPPEIVAEASFAPPPPSVLTPPPLPMPPPPLSTPPAFPSPPGQLAERPAIPTYQGPPGAPPGFAADGGQAVEQEAGVGAPSDDEPPATPPDQRDEDDALASAISEPVVPPPAPTAEPAPDSQPPVTTAPETDPARGRAPLDAALASITLFSRLPVDDRAAVARMMTERRFAAGSVIVRQGDEGLSLYLVLEGEVRVERRTNHGSGVELAVIGVGGFFGEMSLLDGLPRSATVYAVRDVRCATLPRWGLEQVIRANPAVAMEVLSVLSRRLRAVEGLLTN